jgi:hypothetical protein
MFDSPVQRKAIQKSLPTLLQAGTLNGAQATGLPDQVVAVYDDVNGHGKLG